ncbi:MAG: amino acid permease [bacterium]|nr:amino acid permease [bacterium]
MELKKSLKSIDIFCISIGAMVSSGIFVLPGLAFAKIGPAIIIAYALAGACALIASLSMIELTTAMPKAGGNYFFVSRSLGPMVGTMTGFLIWFAISLKAAFAIFGLAALVYLFTGINIFLTSSVLTILFVILNIFGVEKASKLEVILVLIIIPLMILFIVVGLSSVSISNFAPFVRSHTDSETILSTTAFVFISFGGLSNIPSVSEEISNPKKNIPPALIGSILVVSVLYILVLLVTVGVMPSYQLAHSLTPIEDAAKKIIGMPGFIIIAIVAIMAFLTTANAGIMSASRYPLALSRDKLIPGLFGKVNKKYNTPIPSIILTGCFIIIALTMDLSLLVEVASTVLLTMYALINLAVIILRSSDIQNYRPSFKTPFYPWIQLLSILCISVLICEFGAESIKLSIGLVIISAVIYFIYAKKSTKKYALLHFIEKITNKHLTSQNLESELKDIVHSRDDVIKDNFDEIIENVPVLDIKHHMNLKELLQRLSITFASRIDIDKNTLYDLFVKREKESSTVLLPHVAIPHIVIEDKTCFDMVLVRCNEGIYFSEKNNKVTSVIALVGSRDKRNLHLKALAAVAQVIQDKNFDRTWMKARTDNNLRDIFLLSARRRN